VIDSDGPFYRKVWFLLLITVMVVYGLPFLIWYAL
jgi:hypothetical protein